MYVIIAGCGRLGAHLATSLSDKGLDVAVVDGDSKNFSKLGFGFDGITVIGVPIDEDVLRKAGIENADALAAVSQDDNLNIMTALIARDMFNVPKVYVRVGDPEKAEFYRKEYKLETLSLISYGSDFIEGLIKDYSSRDRGAVR